MGSGDEEVSRIPTRHQQPSGCREICVQNKGKLGEQISVDALTVLLDKRGCVDSLIRQPDIYSEVYHTFDKCYFVCILSSREKFWLEPKTVILLK